MRWRGQAIPRFFVTVTSASDGEVALGLVEGGSFTDIAGNTVVHDPGGMTGGSVDADGTLASYDANSPRGRRMDLYEGLPVRLDADTSVSWQIDMTAGFDTYLHFYSKNPDTGALSLLASDDDGGSGLNSKITYTPAVGVEYVIGASAYSSGASSYNLYFKQTVEGSATTYTLHDGEEIPPVGGAGDDILVSGATIQSYTLDTAANPITAALDEDQGLSDDNGRQRPVGYRYQCDRGRG